MFKRKAKATEQTEAIEPVDFPIIDGEPVKAKKAQAVAEPVQIAEPAPVKAPPMCPENYPHLYDIFGNKL